MLSIDVPVHDWNSMVSQLSCRCSSRELEPFKRRIKDGMEASITANTPDLAFLKPMILLPDHHDFLELFYDHVLDVSHISGFSTFTAGSSTIQTGLKQPAASPQGETEPRIAVEWRQLLLYITDHVFGAN
tara:strand:- start:121 stop:510 length:390 start_codon:yes stop_codon:yes gene_type:complete